MMSDEGPQRTEAVLGLRCPACHGMLSVHAGPASRGYACVGGHAYAPARLLDSDDGALRKAVEQALQVWEERASILRSMAAQGGRAEPEFDREAGGLEARIAVLRETLEHRPVA